MLIKKDSLKNEVKSSKNTKTASPCSSQEESYETVKTSANQHPTKTYSTPTPTRQQEQTERHYEEHHYSNDKKTQAKTRLTIKYNVGYPNQLYIRGKGANLSWEKGQPLKNVKADEWVWETDTNFTQCEFKVLINDRCYETGNNHVLKAGSTLWYTPHFS